jgi:PAS domain S-box-containing protein
MPEVTSANLDRALDCVTDIVVVLDRDWRLTYLNRSAERFFGRPREEVIGCAARELLSEGIGAEAEIRLRAASAGGKPVEHDVLAPRSGRLLTVLLIPSDTGAVVYLRDTTQRSAVEAALRESEARYRAFFEHGLDGMAITAPEGEVLSVNPAACRVLDRTEAEIRAAGAAGVVDTRDPRVELLLEERKRKGYARGELTFLRKDGTRVPVEVASAVFLDAGGRSRTSVTLRDLTEQKRVEDRLRIIADAGALLGASLATEDTLRALTELVVPRMADSCVVDLCEASGLRRVAAAHREPHGVEFNLALGSPGPLQDREVGVYKVARTGEAELVPTIDDAWLRAAMREEAYLRVVRSGRPPTSIIIAPFRGRTGVLGVLTLCVVGGTYRYDAFDLTTAQAIADRAVLAIENARLFEQTVQAKRMREDVLGIVSHDLRRPLGAIALNAHALARKTDAREVKAIERAVPRAEALIADLLTAAVLDAGSMPLQLRPENVRSLVEEAVELQRPYAVGRSVRLDASIADGIPPVVVDRHRLLEALGNLLDNALKFTPAGGQVRVDVCAREGGVAVDVSDTGPGIPPEHQAHVFDRFWQGSKTQRASAGLGLSIAKGIIEAHHGSLRVESALGRGTTFTFVLPLEHAAPAKPI